jgi:hypothetical protein
MDTTVNSLETLSAVLAGQHVTQYSDASANAYFELGVLMAHTGMDVPDWLTTAPLWARAAVSTGRSAALHRLRESRQLAQVTP